MSALPSLSLAKGLAALNDAKKACQSSNGVEPPRVIRRRVVVPVADADGLVGAWEAKRVAELTADAKAALERHRAEVAAMKEEVTQKTEENEKWLTTSLEEKKVQHDEALASINERKRKAEESLHALEQERTELTKQLSALREANASASSSGAASATEKDVKALEKEVKTAQAAAEKAKAALAKHKAAIATATANTEKSNAAVAAAQSETAALREAADKAETAALAPPLEERLLQAIAAEEHKVSEAQARLSQWQASGQEVKARAAVADATKMLAFLVAQTKGSDAAAGAALAALIPTVGPARPPAAGAAAAGGGAGGAGDGDDVAARRAELAALTGLEA